MEHSQELDLLIDRDRDYLEAVSFLDSVADSGLFNPLEVHITRFRLGLNRVIQKLGDSIVESFKPLH